MATLTKFEDIKAWQKARFFCHEVVVIIEETKLSTDYKLKDQVNGSSGSIMDNIAEGFGRGGNLEFIQFLEISHASACESQSQLYRILDRKYITGEKPSDQFYEEFKGQFSENFDATKDLERIGVVNQTTMLASDTQAIADHLKQMMIEKYKLSAANVDERFADTRDTLCYATLENQQAVSGMLETDADLAIVVGGYNSSNTSHLVELCEEKLPTYFISSEEKILSAKEILHYNFHTKQELLTTEYLTGKKPVKILITSGASCPDALVEGVINKVALFFATTINSEDLIKRFE